MAKFKTVSQKRWTKGVNAGTGALSQPQSTVARASNLGFTQRGSLQTVGPFSFSVASGTFANFASGQYPYYPALTSQESYSLPNISGITYSLSTGGGGSAFPSGVSQMFSIVAIQGGLHSDPVSGIVSFTPTSGDNQVTLNWPLIPSSATYDVYYLPNGLGNGDGVLIGNVATNTITINSPLPTAPLFALPVGNNSFMYQLQIGNIVSPSKQVNFVATAETFPAFVAEPAQTSPGDPNFSFQEGYQNTSTYTTSTYGSNTVNVVADAIGYGGSASVTNYSSSISGFPSVVISGSQSVTADFTLTGLIFFATNHPNTQVASISFQYSVDSGSSWTTFYPISASKSTEDAYTLNYGPLDYTAVLNGITNLNLLQFRISATATTYAGHDEVLATATMVSTDIKVVSAYSFTPYGGTAGYCCPIPQVIQFAGVTTAVPPAQALPEVLCILILGNGYAPQQCDPSLLGSAVCTSLKNTFQSTYPNWEASVSWSVGDNIAVLISGTNYTFNCTQAGVSGSSQPTSWPTTLNATVYDGQVIWKNTGTVSTIVPRGAAHGIVYAGSLWIANTSTETTTDQLDGPTCIKMSDAGNPNSWNPANVAFIGKDDGTQITGLTTFTIAEVGIAPTGSLVVFKEFSTYQILGVFGATDFQIIQSQTDVGCIAARSIQFLTGYGIIRLTHMGFCLFDGVKDKLLSEEIRPYIYGGTGYESDIVGIDFTYAYLSYGVQSAKPPMYVCACPLVGQGGYITRMFIYDLVLQAWTIMDLPWMITTLMQARTGEGNPLTLGFKADGSGALERFFAGDTSWDASSLVGSLPASATPITWSFRTVYVYREGSSARAFYRKVIIRGTSSQSTASSVTVTAQCDGNAAKTYQTYIQPQPFSGQFEIDVDLMFTGQIVTLNVTGTGVVTIDGLDWQVSEKPGGKIMIG